MSVRQGSAVIVIAKMVTHDGEAHTTHYGPFLPHVGSATTSFMNRLEQELEESGLYESYELSVESVFIGDDESDCVVQAAR